VSWPARAQTTANERVQIRLLWSEVMLAVQAGVMRRLSALKAGQSGVYGASSVGAWDHDINGAIAELACAKWANVYWNGTVGLIGAPDVGRWQIRSKVSSDHRLVVRPTDANDEIFVLVLLQLPNVQLCGWLYGADAKQQGWLKEYPPRPAMYFVEEAFLQPMKTIPQCIEWPISDVRAVPPR
jgi:hypothetical protein